MNGVDRDRLYMERCLELARRGSGFVHPNPLVGCVVVRNGVVVGEGFHRRFGGPHAEVNALKAAGRRSHGGTLYVNLEPCVHHGKTPPCSDAIIAAGIREVVVSHKDPNPLVAGRGLRKLRSAGVRVRSGILAGEAKALNEKFISSMSTRIPFVGVKIAQTLDGRIADQQGRSKWLTSLPARREAHRIRSMYDAVLVGATTAATDNPELTVRLVRGRNPARVVIDPALGLRHGLRLFDTRKAPTIVLTTARALKSKSAVALRLERRGVQVVGVDTRQQLSARALLTVLGSFGITSVLVEGGGVTLAHFFEEKLVRRAHWFLAPAFLGGGVASLQMTKPLSIHRGAHVIDPSFRKIGADFLIEGKVRFS